MTGLVSPPPSIDPACELVLADDWFPPVKLERIRSAIRLGEGVVSSPRLIAAMEGAMLLAFRELATWRADRVVEGATQLADVTDRHLNGTNLAELLWERIVRYLTGAELADLHRDLSATDDGLDRAEERALTADDYRRMAYGAIADLESIGGDPVPRNRVSLV